MKSILDFARAKHEGQRLTMLAAYDALMARLLARSEVDAILVGDSVAMVVHGFPTTIHATVEMMAAHTAAVRRGAPEKFIVADMPFLSVRRGRDHAVAAAGTLLLAGANAVKIEGAAGHADIIAFLVESGVPVMGHLGLTPQSVHQLGGNRLQGRTPAAAEKLHADARALEHAGVFALVLEMIPAALAKEITAHLHVPTIGIGAGTDTDGQVRVLSDLLGLDPDFRPRFAHRYREGHEDVLAAVNAFAHDVRESQLVESEVPA